MSMFSAVVDVSAAASYPTNPQVSLGFEPDEVRFLNESSDGVVLYSFDGHNDHGEVRFDSGDKQSILRTKLKKIWLKKSAGAASPMNVRVSASTDG